jgi:DNA-binding winged helix-turn-helix (wHTH) protein
MSQTKRDHPVLTVIDGPLANQHWTLDREEITIGREEGCDIVLPERQISRQHVRILRTPDSTYRIEDLHSRNGTWVNGHKLEGGDQLTLNDSDEIHLALAIRLQFSGTDVTAPLPFELPKTTTGRLRLDRESRRVFVSGVELDPPLSLPQYRLLELLYMHGGRICTRDAVVDTVWPDVVGEGVSEQAIDALVRRLRDRLAEVDTETQYIVTVRGHGFRLENPPE